MTETKMWVLFHAVALIIIAMTHWIYKWRNPKCSSGKLPPGSMGLPLIGETIQFFIPSKSVDIPSFAKNRIKRFGPVFKTSLAGRPVVVSSDADFSHFILQQEGKLVELWYMDSFAKLLGQYGSLQEGSTNVIGAFHKNIKKLISDYFGPENLKEKLLPELEEMANQTLSTWSCQDSVEVKLECSKMILNFTARHLFGYDPIKYGIDISEMFTVFTQGLMSFPVNIPGTAFHKCMQTRKKIFKMIRDTIQERCTCPEARREDFLDHLIDDMKTENLLTENLITFAIFALLLATFETIPSTLALAIKLLAEHPTVVQELLKEHKEIIESRGNEASAGIIWKENKAMTFTMRVINESLRISSAAVGILRKSIQDIHANGYVIPKGWTIIVLPSAIHLNPQTYQDPLHFNPWRWKDRPCMKFIGFACAFISFHKPDLQFMSKHQLTKLRKFGDLRWIKVKGGEIVRGPSLGFGNGYYIKMWPMGIYIFAFAILVYVAFWIFRWRNPPCNGRLPPGSMGLPLIGETIQFFIPSKSLDMPLFVKNRIKKYGPMFKTSLAGRPVVVSSDADFNHFILQQEGKLVELWYLDSFAELLGQNGSLKEGFLGYVHKHIKKLISEHFGPERLKAKLLPQLEEMVNNSLQAWSKQESVEVKHACSRMILDFTSKLLFSYDTGNNEESLSETFSSFIQGLFSFPLNIPGTSFRKCMQNQKKILNMIRVTLVERRAFPETSRGDFLDSLAEDMKADSLFTDDLVTLVIFVLLLATSETIPSTLTLAIKLLTEHPLVMQELVKENEEIIRSRENKETGLTWKEYKSMTFTMHVINEALRMSGSVGILRRTMEDVYINGYTIPKGWTVMIVPSSLHLNPHTYKDPLAFNPWRWKDLGPNVRAKNFIPFGGGMRTCGGAEFSKVLIAVFLHVFVTKYRCTNVKGGEIVRTPMLGFGHGHYIKVSKKPEMI
eukprot:XP_025014374.1 uncharacterized protein LOC8277841 [Ricinus communis]